MGRILGCLAAGLVCAIGISATQASAGTCARPEDNPRRWYCPALPELRNKQGNYFWAKWSCERECPDAGAKPSGLFPVHGGNADWVAAVEGLGVGENEFYTDLEFVLLSDPVYGDCSRFGFGKSFLSTVFGAESNSTSVLSLIVSSRSIIGTDGQVSGYAIPLYRFERKAGNECRVKTIVNKGFRIARLRAEKKKLNVTAGFVATNNREFLKGGLTADSVLGQVLNGSLDSYAPVINLLVESGAFLNRQSTDWLVNTQIPLMPEIDGKNDLTFSVRMGGRQLAEFRVYQSPDVSAEGALSGVNNYTTALSTEAIGDRLEGSFIPTVLRLGTFLNERISTHRVRDLDRDILRLDAVCNDIRKQMALQDVSEAAIRKLLALAMIESDVRFDLAEPGNENVCLQAYERELVPGLRTKLESRTSCPQTNRGNGNAMDTHVAASVAYVRSNAAVLRDLGLLSIPSGRAGEAVLQGFLGSTGSGRCYLNMDVYRARSGGVKGSCEYAFYIDDPDGGGTWNLVSATRGSSGAPRIIAATLGADIKAAVKSDTWPGAGGRRDCAAAFEGAATPG